jgi:outer membrane protein TolC
MNRQVAGTFLFLFVALVTARAQSPILEAYVREGLENNLALQQRRLDVEKTVAALQEARGLFFPSVTVSTQMTELRGRYLDVGQLVNPVYRTLNQFIGAQAFPTDLDLTLPLKRQTQLQVLQPLFQPEILFNYNLRSHLADAEKAGAQVFARELVAEIKTAYLNVAKTGRVVELYKHTLPLLEENLRVSQRLVQNDQATQEAVLRARAELSDIRQKYAESERQENAASQYFNFLLNRSLDAPIVLDTTLAQITLEPIDGVAADDVASRAQQSREELQQLTSAVEAAGSAVSLSTAAYLPTVGAGLTFGYQGQTYDFSKGKDFTALTLQLQWNLFRGLQDAAKREQAAVEEKRLTVQRMEVGQQIALQARMAADDVAVGRAAIVTARDRLASARQNFQLVARRFALGMAPQIEYLDARTTLTNAAINEILTVYDYHLDVVNFERVVGLYPVPDVIRK